MLVVGILQAFQGMTWVMVLTFVTLYTFALLSVRLIGHGLIFGGPDDMPEEAKVFTGMFDAMFILFKTMNGDVSDVQPLFEVFPLMKAITAGFMVISTWSILSILTAVVSENMISASEEAREDAADDIKVEMLERSKVKLGEIFDGICTNANEPPGHISLKTFNAALDDEDRLDEMIDASDMDKRDLRDIAYIISEREPTSNAFIIERDTFMLSLQQESETVTERALMRVECRLAALESVIGRQLKVKLKQRQGKLKPVAENSQTPGQGSDGSSRPPAPSQQANDKPCTLFPM